ncbi:MAG: hypothetical protein QM756_26455 [Polyangiaceae bacterium]
MDEPTRQRDRLHGLAVVGIAFIFSLGISFWAKRVSEPEQSSPPAPPTTSGIVGWPSSVDPIKTLDTARSLTRRVLLRGMVLEGVRSDGSLPISQPGVRVRYAFQSPAGHGPQPPRVPGVVPRRNLCGRQSVHVNDKGIYADPDQLDLPCAPVPVDGLPEPRCSLTDIWQTAIARGVAPTAVARIEYYRSQAGPAWRFELPDGSARFSVYGDCRRELTRAEASGSVP